MSSVPERSKKERGRQRERGGHTLNTNLANVQQQ